METPATGANPGRAETSKARAKSTASLPEKPALNTFAEQLERIAANDLQWFERHPKRRWRIRPPLPGEYPCGPQMAVRYFGLARMRFPVWGRFPLGLAETLSLSDIKFSGTRSAPIVGGEEHWGEPVGIMRPDGWIISSFGDEPALFRDKADFVAWRKWRAGH